MNHTPRRFVRGLAFGLAASLGLPAATSLATPAEYRLDPEHLTISFLVEHIGYAKTLGRFLEGEGSFVFDEEALTLSDVRVVVQTDSVSTDHEKRDEHLRSDDFLDVDDYPEMTFVGRESRQTGERTGVLEGELTLLGQTRPLTLELTWNKSGPYPFGDNYVTGVSARGTLKRSEYGMTYAVENGWVGDEVELIIEFEAIRQD